MPTTWRRTDIPLPGNLPRKPRHRARNLVNLAEDDYPREACVWVVWYLGVEEEDSYDRWVSEKGIITPPPSV